MYVYIAIAVVLALIVAAYMWWHAERLSYLDVDRVGRGWNREWKPLAQPGQASYAASVTTLHDLEHANMTSFAGDAPL